MNRSRIQTQLLVAGLQLVFIALACVLGFALSRETLIIPKAVLRLPDVHVSQSDMWSLVRIFVSVYLGQIILSNLLLGSHGFSSLRRFGTEYLFYLFAYTTVSVRRLHLDSWTPVVR